MKCKLVDVFANEKLSGNGLTIFYGTDGLTTKQMLSLTQEMRQFESIFLSIKGDKFYARIFTVEEELDFAGHPLIGLAAHLHEEYGVDSSCEWKVALNNQTVLLKSRKSGGYFEATMEQGKPEFIKELNKDESVVFLSALNLTTDNLADYSLEVISTGLPYLIANRSERLNHGHRTQAYHGLAWYLHLPRMREEYFPRKGYSLPEGTLSNLRCQDAA